ncbi:MAG TPA: hypothetical protein GXX51_02740 [Firmicutes bacterium]|nr:hypothetical protein [Bacillota bacterium]
MSVPDVIGYDLDLAEAVMKKCGYTCVVIFTGPPAGTIDGELRVIRQRPAGSGSVVELVVAHDGSPKGGVLHGPRDRG